mmetsp:Transcript_57002/g.133695  ORF Transcript_57002/g.133695 Transcript_57002/m.133695 type:complete len:213 (-) Transcript_57002:1192-1830(-)
MSFGVVDPSEGSKAAGGGGGKGGGGGGGGRPPPPPPPPPFPPPPPAALEPSLGSTTPNDISAAVGGEVAAEASPRLACRAKVSGRADPGVQQGLLHLVVGRGQLVDGWKRGVVLAHRVGRGHDAAVRGPHRRRLRPRVRRSDVAGAAEARRARARAVRGGGGRGVGAEAGAEAGQALRLPLAAPSLVVAADAGGERELADDVAVIVDAGQEV